MSLALVAIDAGKSGAIAIKHPEATVITPMPGTDMEICEFIASLHLKHRDIEVWLEEPSKGGWSVQSKASVATYYFGVGLLYGACVAQGFTIHRVDPKRWQKAIGYYATGKEKMTYAQRKSWLYARARELMPTLDITKDNADAALILYAAERGLLN